MNKNIAKEIVHILIAILLSVIVVRFIFWLLPIILIAICSYYVYKWIKKTIKKEEKTTNNKGYKKKEIKIIDMEDID